MIAWLAGERVACAFSSGVARAQDAAINIIKVARKIGNVRRWMILGTATIIAVFSVSDRNHRTGTLLHRQSSTLTLSMKAGNAEGSCVQIALIQIKV